MKSISSQNEHQCIYTHAVKAHTKAHIRDDGDEDEDDDIEIQGEPSFFNRLENVEAAISGQFVHIELLENMMNGGFVEMRHLATNQYTSLSNQLVSLFDCIVIADPGCC